MADFLIVQAARPRRRAGRRFGKEPVRLKMSDLSKAEIAAIRSDPALAVSEEAAPADTGRKQETERSEARPTGRRASPDSGPDGPRKPKQN